MEKRGVTDYEAEAPVTGEKTAQASQPRDADSLPVRLTEAVKEAQKAEQTKS